jgi:hypothetical protein
MRAKLIYESIFNVKDDDAILSELIGTYVPDGILIHSIDHNFLPGVKYALNNGAHADIQHNLPLRRAVYKGYFDIVKVLLENGADVHAERDEAMMTAKEFNLTDIIDLLKQYS